MAPAISLASSTVEQQVFALLNQISRAVNDFQSVNPQADIMGLRIQRRLSLRSKTMTFQVEMPIIQVSSSGGGIAFGADEVLIAQAQSVPLTLGGRTFTIGGVPILI